MKTKLTLLAITLSTQAQVLEFDQGFDSSENRGVAVFREQTLEQRFQVGIEGTLHRVDLRLFYVGTPKNDLVFRIVKPVDPSFIIAAQDIPRSSIPSGQLNAAWVQLDDFAPVQLKVGSAWNLQLKSRSESVFHAVNWVYDFDQKYENGTAFSNGRSLDVDFTFQTFMEPHDVVADPVAVPEPQTYALLTGLALLGFGVLRRVQSRAKV